MIPILMVLVQASDAAKLSGLTSHQLREWCGRRALVTPDVPAAGRGHLALFSWQTVLALRILNELHDRFGVEVSAWRVAIAELQDILKNKPFPSLWGASVVFASTSEAQLIVDRQSARQTGGLLIELDRHLDVLANTDGIPIEQQLPLFPAVVVGR